MADDLMTVPVVDNTGMDSVLVGTPAPSSVVTTTQPRQVEVSSNEEVDDSPELLLSDTPEQLEDKLLEVGKKGSVAKPTSSKVAASDAKKPEIKSPESFDLGPEDKSSETTQPAKKGARDYTGVRPEYVEVLKHIPNYLYDKAKEMLSKFDSTTQERDTLKTENEKIKSGKLPDNYYEHDKAYLLHPDYDKAVQTQQMIDFEQGHYEQQLEAIKGGADWYEFKGLKNGEPQYELHKALGEGKIDVKAEIYTQKLLNFYEGKRGEVQKQLGDITSNFKQQHESAKKTFDTIDDQFFGKLKDISKLPKEAQEYYNQAKDWLNNALPAYKDHKFVVFLAKAALSNIYKTQEMQKMIAEIKQLKEKAGDRVRVGPTSKDLGGEGKVETEKIYDMNKLDQDF